MDGESNHPSEKPCWTNISMSCAPIWICLYPLFSSRGGLPNGGLHLSIGTRAPSYFLFSTGASCKKKKLAYSTNTPKNSMEAKNKNASSCHLCPMPYIPSFWQVKQREKPRRNFLAKETKLFTRCELASAKQLASQPRSILDPSSSVLVHAANMAHSQSYRGTPSLLLYTYKNKPETKSRRKITQEIKNRNLSLPFGIPHPSARSLSIDRHVLVVCYAAAAAPLLLPQVRLQRLHPAAGLPRRRSLLPPLRRGLCRGAPRRAAKP